MTTKEIELICNSWKTLRAVKPELVGDVFYSKLFLDAPHLRHLFKTERGEQSRKLLNMLNIVVARIDKFEELKAEVRKLALRHRDYGVRPAHYDLVGNALLWTLKNALGTEWTPGLENAWVQCYTTLASEMIGAAYPTPA